MTKIRCCPQCKVIYKKGDIKILLGNSATYHFCSYKCLGEWALEVSECAGEEEKVK